jgi:hypothetical protein
MEPNVTYAEASAAGSAKARERALVRDRSLMEPAAAGHVPADAFDRARVADAALNLAASTRVAAAEWMEVAEQRIPAPPPEPAPHAARRRSLDPAEPNAAAAAAAAPAPWKATVPVETRQVSLGGGKSVSFPTPAQKSATAPTLALAAVASSVQPELEPEPAPAAEAHSVVQFSAAGMMKALSAAARFKRRRNPEASSAVVNAQRELVAAATAATAVTRHPLAFGGLAPAGDRCGPVTIVGAQPDFGQRACRHQIRRWCRPAPSAPPSPPPAIAAKALSMLTACLVQAAAAGGARPCGRRRRRRRVPRPAGCGCRRRRRARARADAAEPAGTREGARDLALGGDLRLPGTARSPLHQRQSPPPPPPPPRAWLRRLGVRQDPEEEGRSPSPPGEVLRRRTASAAEYARLFAALAAAADLRVAVVAGQARRPAGPMWPGAGGSP